MYITPSRSYCISAFLCPRFLFVSLSGCFHSAHFSLIFASFRCSCSAAAFVFGRMVDYAIPQRFVLPPWNSAFSCNVGVGCVVACGVFVSRVFAISVSLCLGWLSLRCCVVACW